MKPKLLPASKTIETKQTYSFDEVLDTLKREGNLPAEPFVYKLFGLKEIRVPGTETQDIAINVSKKKIVVSEVMKVSVTNVATSYLTDGWSDIIGRNVTGIGDMVSMVAEEVRRLFGQ